MLNRNTIESFLNHLSPGERTIVRALRKRILSSVPNVEEKILWGGLSYYRPWIGGPIKGALCQITIKDGAIKLEFVHGVRMKDPKHLLQGERVSKRYLPIRNEREASGLTVKALIAEAAELDPEQWAPC